MPTIPRLYNVLTSLHNYLLLPDQLAVGVCVRERELLCVCVSITWLIKAAEIEELGGNSILINMEPSCASVKLALINSALINLAAYISLILSPSFMSAALAQTQIGFYDLSCPLAESIVRSTVRIHTQSDITIAAGLVRMHFHDCFVRGCDGSVLISGPNAERAAPANQGLRGFEVIDDAKAKIEAVCPGVVSCADILALAARDAVYLSKGSSWRVPLGRRDGRVSFAGDALNMPSPTDSILILKQKFAAKGLSAKDLVLLTGAHTIGQTDCRFFSYRLYDYSETSQSDPSMNSDFVRELKGQCPDNGDGSTKVALDRGSQTTFDTSFFKNVNNGFGVLESDQRLMSDDTTADYVRRYGGIQSGGIRGIIGGLLGSSFDSAFASSMVKMSNIEVKVDDDDGEIREVCSTFN